MKRTHLCKLRWRLAVPLMAAFALLWLGTMALLTHAACEEVEQTMNLQYQSAREALEEQREIYENNLAKGLGAEAEHIMADNLSRASLALTSIMDGGMDFYVRDEAGRVIRSQLAWGYGHNHGVDEGQRWYLRFDDGLDDEGQLELAQWIVEHRRDWNYALYPADSLYAQKVAKNGGDLTNCDGTYARVTGLEQPGHAIAVQKIEIVHPDGTAETMVETSTQGENPIVIDLPFVRISSVLLPSWSSDGRDGPVQMEQRLANVREAQAILDREAAGEKRSVLTKDGRLLGSTSGPGGTMYILAGQCDVFSAALQQQIGLYISTLVLTMLVVLLLSFHLAKKVTQPVEELSLDCQNGRCREDGPIGELNTLASAFNAAQDRLAGQLERERTFTRAAAHELKTPLAVLRAHAEALKEDIAPDRRAHYLDVLLDESDRMAGLVGRLLELARLESGQALNWDMVELSALVREVWSPLSLQLEQKQLTLSLELEEIWLEGDRERLKEAVDNLASNALRHSTPGKTIQVTLWSEPGWACLTVYNDGLPIPEEDLPHLWEPFYRGDKSRSREGGGTGLGLAIVQAATLAHGGRCTVENQRDGVSLCLSFPRKRLSHSGPPPESARGS